MKNKFKKHKFKKPLKNHSFEIIIAVILLVFPSIVVGIYHIPFIQNVNMNIGDLLAYYGVALGIFGSFLTYHWKQEKAKEEHFNESKPKVLIKVDKCEYADNMFTIQIDNVPKRKFTYLYHIYMMNFYLKTLKRKIRYMFYIVLQ